MRNKEAAWGNITGSPFLEDVSAHRNVGRLPPSSVSLSISRTHSNPIPSSMPLSLDVPCHRPKEPYIVVVGIRRPKACRGPWIRRGRFPTYKECF